MKTVHLDPEAFMKQFRRQVAATAKLRLARVQLGKDATSGPRPGVLKASRAPSATAEETLLKTLVGVCEAGGRETRTPT